MRVVAVVGCGEQALVKPALICTAFVTPDQQNRLPFGIESKGQSPHLLVPRKPKFFHVGVSGAFQGINGWPAQMWPEIGQQLGVSQQFVLKVLRQGLELCVKSLIKDDGPGYWQIMDLNPYSVKFESIKTACRSRVHAVIF
jgi:hypothetical protein